MNSKLERLAGLMNSRFAATFAVLAVATAVVVAGCTQSPTPCQLQQSATGGYIIKLTRGGAAAAGCDIDSATPGIFTDVWVFDQYTDQLIAVKSVQVAHPADSDPNSTVYGKGKFTSVDPDNSNPSICKVASLNRMSNETTKAPADPVLAYTVTNMQFLSGTDFLGTEFAADVHVERGGCAADYTAQALSPPVGCEAGEDCDPFHKPFSSGIQSNYNQGCHIWNIDLPDGGTQPGPDPWGEGAGSYIGTNGICFFNADFPSLGSFTP